MNELSSVKFKESIDVSINLGVDPRKSDQVVAAPLSSLMAQEKTSESLYLLKVITLSRLPLLERMWLAWMIWQPALKAGQLDFDVVIASPDAMRVVGQLGQVLGPRGLMPNPRLGTVTADVAEPLKSKAGQVRYRTDKSGIIHGGVGRVGFEPEAIKQNIEALLSDLKKQNPRPRKGFM